ncbi:MAG: hypothetical protein BWY19_00859 [bacterium ADurb.Bin212]|nr:MAG: hypothetical protein BWY19_00859 [bacterium ADurb.Bin212]
MLVKRYFSDLQVPNDLYITFGRKGKRQLGKISKIPKRGIGARLRGKFDTLITINSHFKDERVPEFVVDGTIIHELCHYAHGFHSPLPQLCRYPHQGGIVKAEMIKRGAGEIYLKENKWLKTEWQKHLNRQKTHKERISRSNN